MSNTTVTPTQALSRLLAAAKQINADECKDERVFQALQGEIGVAEGVLRDLPITNAEMDALIYPPRAQLKAEDWDPSTKQPRKAPVAAQSAVAAASDVESIARAMALHAGWSYWDEAKHCGDTLSGNDPDDEREFYRELARIGIAAAPLHEAGNAAAGQAALIDDVIEAIAREHGTGGWQTLADMVRFAKTILARNLPPLQGADLINELPPLIGDKESKRYGKEFTNGFNHAIRECRAIFIASHKPTVAPSIAAPTEVEREAARYRTLFSDNQFNRLSVVKFAEFDDPIVFTKKQADEHIDAAIATGETK